LADVVVTLKDGTKKGMFQKTSTFIEKSESLRQFTINNSALSLTALDYGAVIQKLMFRDKNSRTLNMVVSLSEPEDYLEDMISLGSTVGRYAGRISKGKFELDGNLYELYAEDGVHLHGGREGFGKKTWEVTEMADGDHPGLVFSYRSPHLEEGYPGRLEVSISYILVNNALHIEHRAVTDSATVVNLTNHSYFRLDERSNINHYRLKLSCDEMLETDEKLLPTGRILSVQGTDFDFRQPKEIGQVRMDTPFVCKPGMRDVGEVFSDKSGIRMRIRSNQPAVVVYTPPDFAAICFETQNFPDAPNIHAFPSSVLRPGETYFNSAIFEFDLVN